MTEEGQGALGAQKKSTGLCWGWGGGGIQEDFLGEEASKMRAVKCIVVSLPRKYQHMRRWSILGREKCQKVGIKVARWVMEVPLLTPKKGHGMWVASHVNRAGGPQERKANWSYTEQRRAMADYRARV